MLKVEQNQRTLIPPPIDFTFEVNTYFDLVSGKNVRQLEYNLTADFNTDY